MSADNRKLRVFSSPGYLFSSSSRPPLTFSTISLSSNCRKCHILPKMWTLFISLLWVCLILLPGTEAHVRLTFPPARYPSLDFLDNTRYPAPCGVPQPRIGEGVRTTLRAGTRFNATWFLGYAHQGGFRLELLDETDQPIMELTLEESDYAGKDDATATNYEVNLPEGFECPHCAIRLVRQALEWGPSYQFFSCADVSIVEDPTVESLCSGHGTWSGNRCQCNRLYSGDFCQFRDDCWENIDCGPNGACQDLYSDSYPARVCYCRMGFFGPKCDRFSQIRSKEEFNPALYSQRLLGADENRVYWRILRESSEIEFVLQFPGTSWIALGWRPKNVSPQCAAPPLLPTPPGGTYAEPEPEPEPTREPEIVPDASHYEESLILPALAGAGSLGGYVIPETSVEPEPSAAVPEPASVPSLALVLEPKPEVIQKPGYTANPTAIVEPEPAPAQQTDAVTESGVAEPEPEPVVESVSENSTLPPQPEPDTSATEPPLPASTPSTPPSDPPSTTIQQTEPSTTTQQTETFTTTDPEAAYVTEPPAAVSGDDCYGEWKFPPSCVDAGHLEHPCEYRLTWTYLDATDEIEFSLETRGPFNWWTGVGFSPSGAMADADMIIVSSEPEKMDIYDGRANNYGTPLRDQWQNITSQGGSHVNGVIRASFIRPRQTFDPDDLQFSDTDCYYFLFPVTGGRVNEGTLDKHLDTPMTSNQPICVRTCGAARSTIDPVRKANQCLTEYRFPLGCTPPDCDYHARWEFIPEEESVAFEISASGLGRWTGIGFSEDKNMANSDVVVGWVYDDRPFITDRYAYGKHQPAVDKSQDISGVSGRVEENTQTISFRRRIITSDLREDLPLMQCLYFMFPIGGGRVMARNANEFRDRNTAIGYHDYYVPRISEDPICVCTADGEPLLRSKRQVSPEDYGLIGVAEPVPLEVLQPDAEPAFRQSQPEPEGEPEPVAEGEPEPENGLHPMDCMDIVVGSAMGYLSRIDDYYTVSRATPRLDSFYQGQNSFTGALGYEEDGVTTIMFRRPLNTGDANADHEIMNEDMTVIWAKGQQPGFYSHSPPSGLEAGPALRARDFYELEVLKYHGPKNRGVSSINFFEEQVSSHIPDQCVGSHSYGVQNEYQARWVRKGQDVVFTVESRIPADQWTGIGFTETQDPSGTIDWVISRMSETGQIEIVDRHSEGPDAPSVDPDQNIFSLDGAYSDNGILRFTFTRGVQSLDVDHDVNLSDCVYFVYPVKGGLTGLNGEIQRSDGETPIMISDEKICLLQCADNVKSPGGPDAAPEPEPESEPKPEPEWPSHSEPRPETQPKTTPPTLADPKTPPVKISKPGDFAPRQSELQKFRIKMRLPNEPWDNELSIKGSDRYLKLSQAISLAVRDTLSQRIDGIQNVQIVKFEEGSVIATAEITTRGDKQTPVEVEEMMQEQLVAANNRVGAFDVDPGTVFVQEVKENNSNEIRNYIIIGVTCFLILLAIIVAVCLIARTKRGKHNKDFYYDPNKSQSVPFSPYSYLLQDGYSTYHGGNGNSFKYGGHPGGAMVPPTYAASVMTTDKLYATYAAGGNMTARPYSAATTATANGGGNTPSPLHGGKNGSGPKDSTGAPVPAPRSASVSNLAQALASEPNGASLTGGPTSYREWQERMSEIGVSAAASGYPGQQQQYPTGTQDDMFADQARRRASWAQPQASAMTDIYSTNPYGSYPAADPYGIYSVGGGSRMYSGVPRPVMPGYYRPYQ